jgi:hypothetical protein
MAQRVRVVKFSLRAFSVVDQTSELTSMRMNKWRAGRVADPTDKRIASLAASAAVIVLTCCAAGCGGGGAGVSVSPAGTTGTTGTAGTVSAASTDARVATAAAAADGAFAPRVSAGSTAASDVSAAKPPVAAVSEPLRGVLLQGQPGQSATSALIDYPTDANGRLIKSGVATATLASDTPPKFMLMYAVVNSDATVGQFNAALVAQRARIVDMSYSSSTVTLELPTAADAQAAADTAARLVASKAFVEVTARKITRRTPKPGMPVVEQIDDHQSPG